MNSTPEKFYGVSNTQLSIARHYGGITFNGAEYVYNPKDDTLTRKDVWKDEQKANDAARKAQNKPVESGCDGAANEDPLKELEPAIERGTKAWADVKDVGAWVGKQRGR